jgi:hypothetical protein
MLPPSFSYTPKFYDFLAENGILFGWQILTGWGDFN